MKLYKISTILLAITALVTSCTDWLEQEPVSYLSPDNIMTDVSHVEAAANKFYQDMLPDHGDYSYGTYASDNNTDNQAGWSADNKYATGLWLTASTNGNWSWGNIRNVNYQLNKVLANFKAGKIIGNQENIKQYIGEMYFFRAYAYFSMLQKWGDLPIITQEMPVDEGMLVKASDRRPCNEVARFIIANLDTAYNDYLQDNFEARHTRISKDVAMLFKSRVALYEASWLRYFAGTPFVPNGKGWPGAQKDYNKGYQYPSGSIENEAIYFYKLAAESAQTVADKYIGTLAVNTGKIPQSASDPQNPYFNIWGTTSCANTPEVLLWREYSRSLGVTNNIEVAVENGNSGVGLTRSMVESYLMKDGKPIYASAYTYSDQTIADVAKDRDPRLTIFLKTPGQINYFKNVDDGRGDQGKEIEPDKPKVYDHNGQKGYSTGYAMRKGGLFDRTETINNGGTAVLVVFRATEALLNYMEAEYELTHNVNSGKIMEYWRAVRTAAGFTGKAIDPMTTINATDMSKETSDWGSYSGGEQVDKYLYNIRRERRCEFIGEGLRWMDLQRWRSLDQLKSHPVHVEGMHLWNTPMTAKYDYTDNKGEKKSYLIADGTGNANVSQRSLSEYLRPYEVNMVSNNFKDGLTWHMAHYLQPLPIKQFLLTATDHATVGQSPMYQNPYWPTKTSEAATE